MKEKLNEIILRLEKNLGSFSNIMIKLERLYKKEKGIDSIPNNSPTSYFGPIHKEFRDIHNKYLSVIELLKEYKNKCKKAY